MTEFVIGYTIGGIGGLLTGLIIGKFGWEAFGRAVKWLEGGL